ncbi:MAG: hypothetical protein V5B35_07175 [Candidatus Accumulibacter necessarius]|uniref:phosphoribosyltransferase-like protein n=1 Tax=Candidatus Accumulibacter necessarius TaxID=2954386 RepID=UPI002FC340AA
MRPDVIINEVLAKCDVLKTAGLWPAEPRLRPRAWLGNFDPDDRPLAACLLDKFTYYNALFTDRLFVASYQSLGDGMSKGPRAPGRTLLLQSIENALFTPVRGERPNPTDSGYFLCRKARQLLGIPEEQIVETAQALAHAYSGGTVIFLDDFVGSGDQFLSTWQRNTNGHSFQDAMVREGFVGIYVTLITTDFGLNTIHSKAPDVAVCAAHVLDKKSTVFGLNTEYPDIHDLLKKYTPRLNPKEAYIDDGYRLFGYKTRGLLFGFEHSIPDATLPIFWAPGTGNWEPLIERN